MKKNVKRFLLYLISCLLLILLEGIFAMYFQSFFYQKTYEIVLQSTIVMLFVISLYEKYNLSALLAVVSLLFYDMYYSPFVAFYTIAMMICLAIMRIFKKFSENFLRDFIAMTLGLIIFNSLLYVEAVVVGYSVVPFIDYFSIKIVPTVLFNVLCFMVCYLPFKQLSRFSELKKSIL